GTLVGVGRRSACDIFPVPPRNLLALGKCREGVADRHLARLVALEPHFFEDLAAGKSLAGGDDFEQLFTPRAATARRSARAGLPPSLSGLGRFVRIDGFEFSVDR